VTWVSTNHIESTYGLTVTQAYAIDRKIDDGLPTSGFVTAELINTNPEWAPGYPYIDNGPMGNNIPAITPSPSTCFDNNGVHFTSYNYTLNQSSSLLNCGLSFQMQTGN
jgi:hypothetical protein